jgi:hypothetical protein
VLASVKPPVPRARAVVVCMRLRPARARRLLPAVAVVAKRIDGLAGGGGGGGLGSLDRLRPTLLSQATTLAVSAGEHESQHHRQNPANPHAQRRQESALPRGAACKRAGLPISASPHRASRPRRGTVRESLHALFADNHISVHKISVFSEIPFSASDFLRHKSTMFKTRALGNRYTDNWPPTPRAKKRATGRLGQPAPEGAHYTNALSLPH